MSTGPTVLSELTAKHDLLLDLHIVGETFFRLWSGGLVIAFRAVRRIGNRMYGCPAWIHTTGGSLSSVWPPRSALKRSTVRLLRTTIRNHVFILKTWSVERIWDWIVAAGQKTVQLRRGRPGAVGPRIAFVDVLDARNCFSRRFRVT